MFTSSDFEKKQIVFILFHEGEKLAFSNDNLIVKDVDGKIKFQSTCYRLFLVFAIGPCSITSVLMQKAKKFGFFIVLMTSGFRLYEIVGAEKDGNTVLKKKQYSYDGLEIARHITMNKILNQRAILLGERRKNEAQKEAIAKLKEYCGQIPNTDNLNQLMAYEGLSSKIYFRNHFNNVVWNGRQPRIKRDYVNSLLDIGYSFLFAYIEALLLSFGFDTFCGVMHRQFYMRKSLVCDLVEPFRPIIDRCVKKMINLKQIKEEDFIEIKKQYRLKWECSAKVIKIMMTELLEYKDEIFLYVRSYYRAFMKGLEAEQFPEFKM